MLRLPRITGKAAIAALRRAGFVVVTVRNVLELLAAGNTDAAILKSYPYLEREDLRESPAYAAWLAQFHDDLLPTS